MQTVNTNQGGDEARSLLASAKVKAMLEKPMAADKTNAILSRVLASQRIEGYELTSGEIAGVRNVIKSPPSSV